MAYNYSEIFKKLKLNLMNQRRIGIIKYTIEVLLLSYIAVFFTNKFDFSVDPRIILIVIMGSIYGVKKSIITAVVCFIITILSNGIIEYKYFLNYIEEILILIFFALISGINITKNNIEKEEAINSFVELEILNKSFRSKIRANNSEIKKLSNQISSLSDGYSVMYEIIKKIDKLDSYEFMRYIPEIVSKIIGLKNIAFLVIKDNSDKLDINIFKQVNDKKFNFEKYLNTSCFRIIRGVMENKKIYVNSKLKRKIPDILIPIINHNTNLMIGIVAINGIKLETIDANSEYLLDFIQEFISNYISKKIEVE